MRLSSGVAGAHPAVVNRRIQDLLAVTAMGLGAFAIALGIVVAEPKPELALIVGALAGGLVVFLLVSSPRLDLTVLFLGFYLGCIGGPIKLISQGGLVTSALQNVLILAVLLGLLMRMIVQRRPLRLPPLSGWVLAFVFAVLIEAFNPKTGGILKSFAGFREQLQWVPFFFFGYILIRSKARLRKLFLVLGVIALANGVVSTYQTQLSPQQVGSWGPGYAAKVFEGHRKYSSEGVARVRPMGLGDDSGVGAGFGDIALVGTFALIATMRRRRWAAMLLCLGAMVAIATGLGRLQVVGGVLGLIVYILLSSSAGRRASRPLVAALIVAAIAIPVGLLFISAVGGGVFSRYTSISPGQVSGTTTSYKQGELLTIPRDLAAAPFGFGLGTAGPAKGFGGQVTEELEGHNVNAETQYNFLVDETGLPGLVAWTGFAIALALLAVTRLRFIADHELQVYLAAAFAPVIAMFFMGFDGPVSGSESNGSYFWLAAGIASYWLAGPGWQLARRKAAPPIVAQAAVPA